MELVGHKFQLGLNTARRALAGVGTQTATLVFGGISGPQL
jgi:hypothetical protein